MSEAAEAAVIDSPKLALADNGIGASAGNFDATELKPKTGSITMELFGTGDVFHMDAEHTFLMGPDGNILLYKEEYQSMEDFCNAVAVTLKERHPENEEIQNLTAEELSAKTAETIREGIIRKKAIEAVAMVCAYTNGSDDLAGRHYDLHAMNAAAENVINASKNIEHPEDLLRIDPMEHAVQAITDHCKPYAGMDVSDKDIEYIEGQIEKHIKYDEHGNISFAGVAPGAESVINGVVKTKMQEHFPAKDIPKIQIPNFPLEEISGASLGYLSTPTVGQQVKKIELAI